MSLHHPRRCHIRLNPKIPFPHKAESQDPPPSQVGFHDPPLYHAEPRDPTPSAGGPNDPPPSQAQSRDASPSQAGSHVPPTLQGQPQQAELRTCPPAHAAKITTGTTLLIGSSLIKHVKPKYFHHMLVQTMWGATALDPYHRLSNTTLGPYSQIVLQFWSNDLDRTLSWLCFNISCCLVLSSWMSPQYPSPGQKGQGSQILELSLFRFGWPGGQ